MNRHAAGTPRAALDRQAARWVVRLNRGRLSRRAALRFADWLYRSPAHAEAFRRHARLWLAAESLAGGQSPGREPVPRPRSAHIAIPLTP